MGYYTNVFVDVRIDESKIGEFHREINRIKDAVEENGDSPEDWFGYYWDISVDEDNGGIEFDEYYRKWYEEEKFYDWLLKFKPNGVIHLVGESMDSAVVIFDGDRWAMYDVMDAIACLEKHRDEDKPQAHS